MSCKSKYRTSASQAVSIQPSQTRKWEVQQTTNACATHPKSGKFELAFHLLEFYVLMQSCASSWDCESSVTVRKSSVSVLIQFDAEVGPYRCPEHLWGDVFLRTNGKGLQCVTMPFYQSRRVRSRVVFLSHCRTDNMNKTCRTLRSMFSEHFVSDTSNSFWFSPE